MLNRGLLRRLERWVYRSASAPIQPETRLWSAVLTTGGVLYSSAAAYVWGLFAAIPEEIEVNVGPHRRVRQPAGVRVRHFPLADKFLTTRFGLPVTERSQAALDHLAGQPIPSATAFADRAISQGWLTISDLERRLNRRRSLGTRPFVAC